MNKPKVDYFACLDIDSFPGVERKLSQTISALKDMGYEADLKIVGGGKFSKYINLLTDITKSKADIIIIRNLIGLLICFPALIIQRAKKNKIIIDVPTPTQTIVKENPNSKTSSNTLRSALYHLLFPLSHLPANSILQYSEESAWFKFGLSKKTKIISNGVDVKSIPERTPPKWPTSEFILICAASVSDWHGLDRVIRGIHKHQQKNQDSFKLIFFIVGDGPSKKTLQELTEKLEIQENVKFTGMLKGAELDNLFDKAHVAISSLGLFRKGLDLASDLKSREYTARGIPFVAAGNDLDFSPPPRFVKKIPNDNSSVDIGDILDWYSSLTTTDRSSKSIRYYAIQNLDFRNKIIEILK